MIVMRDKLETNPVELKPIKTPFAVFQLNEAAKVDFETFQKMWLKTISKPHNIPIISAGKYFQVEFIRNDDR